VKLPPRLQLVVALTPPGGVIVDVGCDHGHTAQALGAIATEREPHRLPRRGDIPRVVADGLRGFRSVDTAVITGMGAHVIRRILQQGPQPSVAVVHSPQHTDRLRAGLAEDGWRIDAERLAPEGKGFAEVIRVVRGSEPNRSHSLWFGPLLPRDPLCAAHARTRLAAWEALLSDAPEGSDAHLQATAWIPWLEDLLHRLPSGESEG
jgi:tRNA A22 N-methylase